MWKLCSLAQNKSRDIKFRRLHIGTNKPDEIPIQPSDDDHCISQEGNFEICTVYSAEFSKKCELEALWGIYDADCLKMLLPLYSQGINGETCTSLESDGDDEEEEEKDDNDENNEDSEEEEDSVKSRRKSRKGYQT